VGPFVFRACFDDVRQGKAAARYVVENARNKRIGLIFASDDPYSSGLAGAFRDEAAKRGAYLVEQRILHDETNPIAQLGAIARHNPDLVYVPVYYTMVPGIAKAARAAGIDGRRLVGSDGWEASQLLDEAGDLLEGAVFTDHWVADAPWPASRAFVAAYRRRFQRDPSTVAALGHDAAKLLADAIGRAENGSREAVQRALATTRGFEGATGTISMGPGGEPDHAVVIVRIEARRFHHHTIVRPDAP
jgi:branched-chain amino acid transport system substrate-binding protein